MPPRDLLAEYHAGHDCAPCKCICECGCDVWIGCTALGGGMCSVCMIREQRDEGDGPHRTPSESTANE